MMLSLCKLSVKSRTLESFVNLLLIFDEFKYGSEIIEGALVLTMSIT